MWENIKNQLNWHTPVHQNMKETFNPAPQNYIRIQAVLTKKILDDAITKKDIKEIEKREGV